MAIRLGRKPKLEISQNSLCGYEAARYLRIGYQNLKGLVESGEIPCRKFGKRTIRFSKKALDRYLDNQKPEDE